MTLRSIGLMIVAAVLAPSAEAFIVTIRASRGACDREDVHEISRPVYPDRPDSESFPYKYQYVRGTDDSKPVIVFMPGGPGGGAITDDWSGFVPEGYGVVLTDQRGANCNDRRSDGFPAAGYQTRYLADDVVEIVRHEGLRNYILYGHSYGTMHATMVASQIEARRKAGEDLAAPAAVVLEGVIGHAFGAGEAVGHFQKEWAHVKTRLAPEVQERLRKVSLPFAELDDVAGRWGTLLQNGLYAGRFPQGNDLARSINFLGTDEEPQLRELVANSQTGADGYGELFKIIGCREIFVDFPHRMVLRRGELTPEGQTCAGGELVDAYDSQNWPIEAPTFYFAGARDPATPLAHAEYAYAHSVSRNRNLIMVGEAGHSPLMHGFRSAGCRGKVWDSLSRGGDQLQPALWDCHWPWSVTLKNDHINN